VGREELSLLLPLERGGATQIQSVEADRERVEEHTERHVAGQRDGAADALSANQAGWVVLRVRLEIVVEGLWDAGNDGHFGERNRITVRVHGKCETLQQRLVSDAQGALRRRRRIVLEHTD